METPNDPIRSAADLIRVGRREDARPILAGYLQAHPDSVDGWMLMSMCISDRQRQIDCLRQVLRIQPDHSLASSRLLKLTSGTDPVSTWSTLPPRAEPPSAPPSGTPPFTELPRPDAPPLRPFDRPVPSAASPPPAAPPPASGGGGLTPIVFVLLLVALLCAAGGIVAYLFTAGQRSQQATQFARAATIAAFTLPPTWTPTTTPTITPTRTPTLTPSVTPTPTPPRPNPTILAEMDIVQVEVADIRGLEPLITEVPRYLLSKAGVRPVLAAVFTANGGTQAELDDEARVLSALGLIKPTYNLYNNALNSLADNIGGFYFPWNDELYVIGTRFSGIERFIFAHEYGHALVDQHFHIDALQVYPTCLGDAQRCQAIRALVEGDATLVMNQWWQQYASPQDYTDILNYRPPAQTLPEQFPPPYVLRDSDFPYVEGREFVEALYARGRWAQVDAAYANLPDSTEQILHPSKYFANEEPEEMPETTLGEALGAGWRLLQDNSLGEWMTYLVLGYGADVDAQLPDDVAARAAAGWGGDRYVVYHHDDTDRTVMAARWSWDTMGDATTFYDALSDSLHERYAGNRADVSRGRCWEANAQRSCLYRAGRETLWLLAPDSALVESMLSRFPGFN